MGSLINFIGAVFLISFFLAKMKIEGDYDRYMRQKIDGVETIDGITYLVPRTDMDKVMDVLEQPRRSRIIKNTTFERLNESEGYLTFGAIFYVSRQIDRDSAYDIGATYKICCTQKEEDTIMEIRYEGHVYERWCPKMPDLMLNQAYHRFFKEQLFVRVIKDTGETND